MALECIECHKKTVAEQMAANSHHVQGTEPTGRHCYACHWEATPDGKIDERYHEGKKRATDAASSGAKIDLVVWGKGTRPTEYKPYSTAIPFSVSAIGAPQERAEVARLSIHCMSCHSDQNNDTRPFAGDRSTPRQYAWDRQSVASRYQQKGTTVWGKYSTATGNGKKRITKAFSAHGNATANQGGWSTATGYDGDIPVTRGGSGARNVECFDCHNSHGSAVPGVTSSYKSYNGTFNGGILKEITAGTGGYRTTYRPTANGDPDSSNPYNPGAGLCFDCHESAMGGITPWGYQSTFGASQPIMGYKDTLRFGPGMKGSAARHTNRPSRSAIASSHLKAGKFLNYTAQGQIGGLCTPCHDPHGVSPTLGSSMQYAVPLLKGTWLTSPYREDAPPPSLPEKGSFPGRESGGKIVMSWGKGGLNENPADAQTATHYNIDRNTFGETGRITETDSQFGGLCLKCHLKEKLAGGAQRDRIHLAVKGWGANKEHAFPCSKCHQAHNSGLPRLMQTNCLFAGPSGLRDSGAAPWFTERSANEKAAGRRTPQSGNREGAAAGTAKKTVKEAVVGCHVRRAGRSSSQSEPATKQPGDSQWNKVTPW
jgi:hypothetical protein